MIVIGGKGYELMLDHKDGWNPEAFRGRYSEVLDRYDYIIGDWGYSQLRLKGFFRDNHPKVNKDTAFSGMVDYINEYCNFGCAYFVLQKMKELPKEGTYTDILLRDAAEEGEEREESSVRQETAASAASPAPQREQREPREHVSRQPREREEGGKSHGAKEQRHRRDHHGRSHRSKDRKGHKEGQSSKSAPKEPNPPAN
ncbi:YutD family protein [Paenibacillus sp. NFR01]|uniref:YutD family protein n=1 Tax=Paenibacillus sp. NFR01 TaxID=1566279 RepID=UPI0008CDD212|nr:YutD family protein [Paenibacillus sp. NFR01]SEU20148.1 Uncharacterized protein YutD [Paenibacillus sp. NFR01]